MKTANPVDQRLAEATATMREIHDRHRPALASSHHRERTGALANARSALDVIHRSEQDTLTRAQAKLTELRDSKLAELEAAADKTRLALGAAIVADLRDAKDTKGIPALLAQFFPEPTRQGASAIRGKWDELKARAQNEIGELSPQTLGALIVDTISADTPNAVNAFEGEQFGSSGIGERLAVFVTSPSRAEQENALIDVEDLVRKVTRQFGPGGPYEHHAIDPDAAALHALRSKFATSGDLAREREQLAQAQGARRQAERAASQPPAPPPPRPVAHQTLEGAFRR